MTAMLLSIESKHGDILANSLVFTYHQQTLIVLTNPDQCCNIDSMHTNTCPLATDNDDILAFSIYPTKLQFTQGVHTYSDHASSSAVDS
jgi:hypothetical protein